MRSPIASFCLPLVLCLGACTEAKAQRCGPSGCSTGYSASAFQFQAPAQHPSAFRYLPPAQYEAPAAQPLLYEKTDADGTVWQHRDKPYLVAWIAGRNRALKTTTATPATERSCSGGCCKCSKADLFPPLKTTSLSGK